MNAIASEPANAPAPDVGPPAAPPDISVREVAEMLDVPESFVLNLLESGGLPYRLAGGVPRVSREDAAKCRDANRAARYKLLEELAAEAQSWGMY